MTRKKIFQILSGSVFLILFSFSPINAENGTVKRFPEKGIESVEERRLLLSLQKEKQKIEEREKKLNMKEFELKTLAQEVDKKLQEIKIQRKFLEELLATRDEVQQKKIRSLSKIFEKMDPVKAAAILDDLEDDLAIGVLEGMKSKSAGKLLSQLDQEKAARLSVYFTLHQKNKY
jgi:flagellar motility protein MotE (MotC chaperone)